MTDYLSILSFLRVLWIDPKTRLRVGFFVLVVWLFATISEVQLN